MSDLSSTSCFGGSHGDSGFSPIFLILILCLCGGDGGGLFGGFGGNDCGSNGGFGGILPILLILCLCGGSF